MNVVISNFEKNNPFVVSTIGKGPQLVFLAVYFWGTFFTKNANFENNIIKTPNHE